MSQVASSRHSQRRTGVVCTRCKKQHIRCDAETQGSPCSNCHRAGIDTCSIIRTRRARATTGRFVANNPSNPLCSDSTPAIQPSVPSSSPTATGAALQPKLDKTTELPEFPLNLEALYSGSETAASLASPEDDGPTSLLPKIDASTPRYGDSWYLSLVVQMTNTDSNHSYQPLLDLSDRPSRLDDDGNTAEAVGPRPTARPDSGLPVVQDLPPPEVIDEILDQYFTYVHTFCPILDKRQFLKSVTENTVSPILLRCVLFVASIHCDIKILFRLGYNSRIEAEDDLFNKAQSLFNMDSDSDRLTLLRCSYLLHYWSGSPTKAKDPLWWLAGAIRFAQSLGMHRSMEQNNAHCATKRLWRRTWWLLYIRDRQVSLSLGKPMMINDRDCDVEPVEESDFADDSEEIWMYVSAQARLSQAVGTLQHKYLSPGVELCSSDQSAVFRNLFSLFSDWRRQLPSRFLHNQPCKSQLAIILNLTYNYYSIILNQIMQRRQSCLLPELFQASNEMIMTSAEAIASLIEDAVTHSEARCFPMICLSAVFASMTAQYTQARSANLSEVQRTALMQSVKYKMLALKEFEDCHVLAKWIRHLFTNAMCKHKYCLTLNSKGTQAPAPSADEPGNSLDDAAHRALSALEAQDHNLYYSQPWDEWLLTHDLGHPDTALVASADLTNVGLLPFPWSDCYNAFDLS